MPEYGLNFSASSSIDAGSFKLLELPPELCTLIESASENAAGTSLSIKGRLDEDAVLCTSDRTYTIRSVLLSNSILVITSPPDSQVGFLPDTITIRDQLNEIMELSPAVPKLHRLVGLLRGKEYDQDEDIDSDGEEDNKSKGFSYDDVRTQIQASDAELDRGIRDRHILIINNQLRPIAAQYLNNILELLLNHLVSLSLSHASASVEALASALADDHEIPRLVSTQVMTWFGEMTDGKWTMNVDGVVKEVGLGILRKQKDDPIETNELISSWKLSVGDAFESSVSLSLLSGNYLVYPSSTGDDSLLKYFPSSALPVDPAARFADLFLTRSRWKEDAITPFISDIAVNSKERDKLLLKYTRPSTDASGVWYTARATYNG